MHEQDRITIKKLYKQIAKMKRKLRFSEKKEETENV